MRAPLTDLPLAFIPNLGQLDPAAQFAVQDQQSTMLFADNEIILTIPAAERPATDPALPSGRMDQEPAVVRIRFERSHPRPQLAGVGRLPGVINYFLGDDPAGWHVGTPTYAGIRYEQLYPGIDLHYDGASRKLKGTYVVAPAADPALIRWRYVGAKHVQVEPATGDLIASLPHSAATQLRETAPIAWQTIDALRVPVAARYVLADDGSVGFALGAYDPRYPLMIDPVLVFSTYLGGGDFDSAEAITVDDSGNIYVTGTTSSADMFSSPIRPRQGGEDVFVSKYGPKGAGLIYSTYIGGSRDGPDSEDRGDESEDSNSIAVDASGSVYLTGATDAIDFPTTPGSLQPTKSGQPYIDDAFVVKLGPNGALSYSTYLGGRLPDEGEGIAVDAAGQAYVVGFTSSENFPTKGGFQGSFRGDADAFLVKLSSSGSALVYGTLLGGSSFDAGAGIAIDAEGSAYITGVTRSGNFPIQGAAQASNNGGDDLFITKVSSGGDNLIYSTYLGGKGNETAEGIALDGAGGAYLTGITTSDNFPTLNPFQSRFAGCSQTAGPCGDAFVVKLNAGGNTLAYSSYLGGSDRDDAFAIAVSRAGEAYVVGATLSGNFPVRDSLQSYAGSGDAFVTALSADGSSLLYGTYLGGGSSDVANAIAVDNAGNAYVAGFTLSQNFPQQQPVQATNRGFTDAFVTHISYTSGSGPVPQPALSPRLLGSYLATSRVILPAGETATFTITLVNSGTSDATVTVSIPLPSELDYVDGSAAAATYNPTSRTLAWTAVQVPMSGSTSLSYQARGSVSVHVPTEVLSKAVIAGAGASFELSAMNVLSPTPTLTDQQDRVPPQMRKLTIGQQDVLTERATTLAVEATDDIGVSMMYVREWWLETDAFPSRWVVSRSSGWIPYKETLSWELDPTSGTHVVGVWVKDRAGRVSRLSKAALDTASLLLPDSSVRRGRAIVYQVTYSPDETVNATLDVVSGDADLYVWYPGHVLLPNKASIRSGLSTDSVSFTTPRAGAYLFVVFGAEDSRYKLQITPSGSSQMAVGQTSGTGEAEREPGVDTAALASDNKAAPSLLALLADTGFDPLGGAVGLEPETAIYLPEIAR